MHDADVTQQTDAGRLVEIDKDVHVAVVALIASGIRTEEPCLRNRLGGEIVGEGRNMREGAKNALAHAELMAIDSACRRLGGWRLPECAIYVTLEPCPMCCGAIINARIDDVIFGAYDLKSGSAVSVQKMFTLPYNYRPEVTGGVMEEECAGILSEFFRQLRIKKSGNAQ